MDAKQIFDEIMSITPFVCGLPKDDTHSWVIGTAYPTDHIVVDFLFDSEVKNDQLLLAARIVERLLGAKPYKGYSIKIKIELDGDVSGGGGCIKVHNLHPGAAVRLSGWLGAFSFDCHYSGGDDRFADTFYAFKEVA
jgi:hypothetical protein